MATEDILSNADCRCTVKYSSTLTNTKSKNNVKLYLFRHVRMQSNMMNVVGIEKVAQKTCRRGLVAEDDCWNMPGHIVLKQY